MKTCIACGGEFELNDFYGHSGMADGHLNKCKSCCKKQAAARRQVKLKEIKAYDKERGLLPRRLKANRDRQKANPLPHLKANIKYIRKNPDKAVAWATVAEAVEDGTLERQPCEVCGKKKVHAHHDDYSKPLEIRWLCDEHHKERHRRLKKERRENESEGCVRF
jgi:hypothetical protein